MKQSHAVNVDVMLMRLLRLAPRNDGALMEVLCAVTLLCARSLRGTKHPSDSELSVANLDWIGKIV